MMPVRKVQFNEKSEIRARLKPRVLELIILSYSATNTEAVAEATKELK